jgi:hypothetical protein
MREKMCELVAVESHKGGFEYFCWECGEYVDEPCEDEEDGAD